MLCRNCGREIESQEMRFCPFCGTEIISRESLGDAQWLFGQIKSAYGDYMTWNLEYFANRGAGAATLALFTGNAAYKNSKEHSEFFDRVRDLAEKLCDTVRTENLGEVADSVLQYALLDCHSNDLPEADLMYMAAEQLFIPCIDVMSPEKAAGIYESYKKLRKKSPGFKPQDEILKKLKKAAK